VAEAQAVLKIPTIVFVLRTNAGEPPALPEGLFKNKHVKNACLKIF
jgi:hypothetical protein